MADSVLAVLVLSTYVPPQGLQDAMGLRGQEAEGAEEGEEVSEANTLQQTARQCAGQRIKRVLDKMN